MDQVHLAIEARQSSVNIIEFKAAIFRYVRLVHEGRSQVDADDLDMWELAGHRHSPEQAGIKSVTTGESKIPNREVLAICHSHTLKVESTKS